MRILVTGASGFVGQHLVERLLAENHEVIAFDKRDVNFGTVKIRGDIVTFNFEKILENVDFVFHLASLLGTTELFHRVVEAEKVNVLGTLNLLEAMRNKGLKKIIFTSKPNFWKYNPYTITKQACENYLQMYQQIYGFNAVIVRPFNIYGPGEELVEYRKAIPYFILAALKGEPIEVFGNGEQTMDAIYIDDAIEALIRSAKIAPTEVVEIGSSTTVKVKELAEKILDLAGNSSSIVYVPMRRGEGNSYEIRANGNMSRLLGLSPKVSLDEGLRKTIGWYSKHIEEFNNIYELRAEDFASSEK